MIDYLASILCVLAILVFVCGVLVILDVQNVVAFEYVIAGFIAIVAITMIFPAHIIIFVILIYCFGVTSRWLHWRFIKRNSDDGTKS